MNNEPLVSIIITTYKRNNYLKRAIQSALNQTYKNIEVLVVDDNDPNLRYSQQVKKIVENINDSRLIYMSMGGNFGACVARNSGFSLSKGLYINFLDDDDVLLPEKIELQIKKYSEVDNDIGMIGCFAQIKDEKENIIQYDRNRVRGNVFYENLCHSLCQTSLPLIRRDIFEISGGFEKIISSQEHLMLARVLNICPNYDYVDKELVTIYHHSGKRISNSKEKPLGAIELANKFKRYYYKLNNEQIRKLELCMNTNIINSYVLIGDKKTALKYFMKRNKIIGKDEFKLIFGIVFGNGVKQKIHHFLLRKGEYKNV